MRAIFIYYYYFFFGSRASFIFNWNVKINAVDLGEIVVISYLVYMTTFRNVIVLVYLIVVGVD